MTLCSLKFRPMMGLPLPGLFLVTATSASYSFKPFVVKCAAAGGGVQGDLRNSC